ncbi:YcjX family protein [Breoghania sp. L-A4]|uniref:YcjX family protein n=1 Tax=Breoghania sp. L-A4 TaxID=2304600 RepID=UPI0020BF92A8|nr:YcjX family protein [Breoghania sp. L-A4]
MKLPDIADEARLALANLSDAATNLTVPTMRLGVTGLSRAGKTVFISALVHNLIHGGRLPMLEALAGGRLARAYLQPQPDDAVPRFDYESHINALLNDRVWPHSTMQVSELRLTLEFESAAWLSRTFGSGKLHLDIVDYPGEWLLDLPLLSKDYATWSREALALSRSPARAPLAKDWHRSLEGADPAADADESTARDLAARFTSYLAACRHDEHALSLLPPGRFLMPGDMQGSPALTFAPLDVDEHASMRKGSLHAMMERRYESYKRYVVKPFFRDHFARIDRQIVLVDTLAALNAGPAAIVDLEAALEGILTCFRPGKNSWLSSILARRTDRILFAATKADHVHHGDHDRLEAILRRLVAQAIERAEFAGADVDVVAMAAIRATREAQVEQGGDILPAILGTPLAGERINGEAFDGTSEIAMFPGDLPDLPESIYKTYAVNNTNEDVAVESQHEAVESHSQAGLRFLRFQPPKLERTPGGRPLSLPHIRLDRALQFLIGDRLA